MARSHALLAFCCLLGMVTVALAQVNDDKCDEELQTQMTKYSDRPCRNVLNTTITATSKDDCPNKNQYVDCFAVFEDSWTDLYDDCEDIFDNSACLKSLGDDQFERMVKDDCARKRRGIMQKYDAGADARCIEVLTRVTYASDDSSCPSDQTEVAQCFAKFEDDWTDLMDDCESLWANSGCSWLRKLGDDEFEAWVKDNSASRAASIGGLVLAAVGAAVLLAV